MEVRTLNYEGVALTYYTKTPEENIRGVVQLLHGASEHAKRYEPLLTTLVDHGYAIIAHDQIGHGESRLADDKITFGKTGTMMLLGGAKGIYDIAKEHWSDKPIYLFAHSMGSFVGRALMAIHGDLYDGVILSGSTLINKPALYFGIALSGLIKRIRGDLHVSPLIANLSQNRPINRMIKDGIIEHPHEWVTNDKDKQREAKKDALVGLRFTVSAQNAMFKVILKAHNRSALNKHVIKSPLAVFCGAEDALCDYGDATLKLETHFTNSGINVVKRKVYPNTRHEILNDHARDTFTNDIITLFNNWSEASAK